MNCDVRKTSQYGFLRCVCRYAALTADGEFVLPLTNEPHRKHRIAFQILF